MTIHGHTAPGICLTPTTLITVHGTAAQIDVLANVIADLTAVVTVRQPEPCPDLDGCFNPNCDRFVLEVVVLGHDVDIAQLNAAWLAVIASRN